MNVTIKYYLVGFHLFCVRCEFKIRTHTHKLSQRERQRDGEREREIYGLFKDVLNTYLFTDIWHQI